MSDWIAAGFAQQIGFLIIAVFVVGVIAGAGIFLGIPWLWHHVSIIVH
jgi:hypothetical protein